MSGTAGSGPAPEAPREGALGRFRYEYGAQPLHLLAMAASLLICAYAILRITEIPSGGRVLIWLAVAAVLHDLVAWPLYTVLLRLSEGAAGAAIKTRTSALAALNHVRVPAAVSLLMLLVFFPLILRVDPDNYEAVTGLSLDPYLGHWLLISAALFALSGIGYALRLRRGVTLSALDGIGERRAPRAVSVALRAAAGVVLAGLALTAVWAVAVVVVGLLSSGLGL